VNGNTLYGNTAYRARENNMWIHIIKIFTCQK
jgi:hypothetical protein